MTREPPKPSDAEWAAFNAPFTLHEAESHPGTWIIRNKDDAVIDQGSSRVAAQLVVDLWNDEAARFWMQAP
jgi:uncharacterized protein YqgV (UPF0045/DUF77 family)